MHAGWELPAPPSPRARRRLASNAGSDDYTLFLWEPSTQKQPKARMTGHMQLINQARHLQLVLPRLLDRPVQPTHATMRPAAKSRRSLSRLTVAGLPAHHLISQVGQGLNLARATAVLARG